MSPLHRPTGFTLVELVTSMVIIGIMAAAIAPRFIGNQSFSERGYADEVAAALRYAQAVAVASGCSVRVTLNASGYQARQPANAPPACSGGWTRVVTRVDGGMLAGAAPGGVTLSPATQIVFNNDGRIVGASPPAVSVHGFTLNIAAGSGLVTVQ